MKRADFPEFSQNQIACPQCDKMQLRPRARTGDFRCQACTSIFEGEEIEGIARAVRERAELREHIATAKAEVSKVVARIASQFPAPPAKSSVSGGLVDLAIGFGGGMALYIWLDEWSTLWRTVVALLGGAFGAAVPAFSEDDDETALVRPGLVGLVGGFALYVWLDEWSTLWRTVVALIGGPLCFLLLGIPLTAADTTDLDAWRERHPLLSDGTFRDGKLRIDQIRAVIEKYAAAEEKTTALEALAILEGSASASEAGQPGGPEEEDPEDEL